MVAYCADHSLGDRSLRELAAGVGTSHRMLIYHFGSREGLVAAVVGAVEERQRDGMAQMASATGSPPELMRAIWGGVTDEGQRPFVRLFFEVLAHALQGRPGTEGFAAQLTAPWLERGVEVAETMGERPSVVDLQLGVAVVRGLLIDVLTTDDLEAATAAFERYVQLWEASSDAPADAAPYSSPRRR